MSVRYLTAEEIIALWRQAVGDDQGRFFVRDRGLVASAAARPLPVFGEDAYPSLIEKAAALLHSVCANHAFSDGNKRAAFKCANVFLMLNGAMFDPAVEDELFKAVLAVASGQVTEVDAIAERLAPHVVASP